MNKKSIQIQIAERAGVSQTFVSFVINDNKKQLARMKPETVERVRAVAEEMGYYRNELFAAVRRGRSRFIALLARNVSMEYYARVIEEIMDATEQLGYTQKLFKLRDEDGIHNAVKQIQEYRIPGGVLLDIDRSIAKQFDAALSDPSFKSLQINSDPKSFSGGTSVQVDGKKAMTHAIEHLYALGHRRIAYVGPADNDYAHTARRKHFEAELANKGLPASTASTISISWDLNDGCDPLFSGLKDKNRPTAIICYSDLAAMIVYHAAGMLGLGIPKQLSVIGFDNDDFACLMSPPLTTFQQDLSVIRDRYVPELIQSIETGVQMNRRKRRLIPVSLIERTSTGPAPKTT
jgi:LacI family transcriptional regulator